jgi:hypothetical protein
MLGMPGGNQAGGGRWCGGGRRYQRAKDDEPGGFEGVDLRGF